MDIQMKGWKLGAIAAVLAVAGCGGGGGGGSATSAPTEVSGAAVKGTVKRGKVVVREFAPNTFAAASARVVGEGVTDNKGEYRIAVSGYQGGAVELVITPQTNAAGAVINTRVVCDVDLEGNNDCGTGIKFGDEYTPPANFSLETCLDTLTGSGVTVINASPVTSLIANRALRALRRSDETRRSTRDAIRAGIGEVNSLFGGQFNVVTTRPVDVTTITAENAASQNAEGLAYGAIVAAVQGRASGGDIATTINTFVSTFSPAPTSESDSSLTAVRVDAYEELVEQIRSTVDALPEVAQGAVESQVEESLAVVEAIIDQTEGNTVVAEAPPAGNAGAVPSAKGFIADIRSIANEYDKAIKAKDPALFVTELENVGKLSMDKAMRNIFDVTLSKVSDEAEKLVLDTPNAGTRAVSFSCGTQQQPTTKTINLVKTRNNDGTTTVTANGESCTDTVDLTAKYPTNVEQRNTRDNVKGASLEVSMTGVVETTEAGKGVKLELSTGKLTATSVDANASVVVCPSNEDRDNCNSSNLDKLVFDVVGKIIAKAETAKTEFVGKIGFTAVRCNTQACATAENSTVPAEDKVERGLPTRIALDGTLTRGNLENKIALLFSIDESAARSFDAVTPGENFDFNGPLIDFSTLKAELLLSADVSLPDLPKSRAVISIKPTKAKPRGTNTAGRGAGSIEITLVSTTAQGAVRTLKITSSITEAQELPAEVRFESGSNAMVIRGISRDTPETLRGELLAGSELVGRVEQARNGVILVRYADGTFESLN